MAVVVQLEINCRKNLAYSTTVCPNLGFQYCLGLSRAFQAIRDLVLEALAYRQWRQSQMFHTTETLGSFFMFHEENSPEGLMAQPEMLAKVLRCLTRNPSSTLSSLYQKVHSRPRPEAKLSCGGLEVAFLPTGKRSGHC